MKIVELNISYMKITNDLAKRWYMVDSDKFNVVHRTDGPAETWLNFNTLIYDHFFLLNGKGADAPLDWDKNKSYTGGLLPF